MNEMYRNFHADLRIHAQDAKRLVYSGLVACRQPFLPRILIVATFVPTLSSTER